MITGKSAVFGLVLLLCGVARGGEEGGPNAKDGWQRLFREQASAYRIEVGESGQAELLARPVLQWPHPARGGEHGAIFLWVKDGLPITIGTLNIWRWTMVSSEWPTSCIRCRRCR
jgi:hypothetical protein